MFSFSNHGSRKPSHSFPTRRSSDLAGGSRRCERRSATQSRAARPPCAGSAGQGLGVRVHTDRKSTRLNSSHTVISYAVFCLKKKTSNLHTNTRDHRRVPACVRVTEP